MIALQPFQEFHRCLEICVAPLCVANEKCCAPEALHAGVAGEALVCGVRGLGVAGGNVGKAGNERVQRECACKGGILKSSQRCITGVELSCHET